MLATTTTTSPAMEWPTDGWPASTPEEQGIQSGLLADLVEEMVVVGGLDSVTVIRNGHLVLDATVALRTVERRLGPKGP